MARSTPPTATPSATTRARPLVIAVAGRKGGVGKTTVASGLLSVLHSTGLKVLGLDLDPQSNLAFGLGAEANPRGHTSVEFLLQMRPEPQHIAEGFDVIPGNQGLTGEQVQALHPDDLSDLLKDIDYDVVVIDCPPGQERLEHQAIAAADIALIVLNAHPYAMVGATRVHKHLVDTHARGRRGPTPDHWAFVMCQIDERRRTDRELPGYLAETFPSIARFAIRQDAALAAASTEARPVMDASPSARGVVDLSALATWCQGHR